MISPTLLPAVACILKYLYEFRVFILIIKNTFRIKVRLILVDNIFSTQYVRASFLKEYRSIQYAYIAYALHISFGQT